MSEDFQLPTHSDDGTLFMRQPLWFGWKRWTWVRLAFLLMVLAGALGFWLQAEANTRDDKQDQRAAAVLAQAAVNEDYQTCLRGNDVRQVIREVVDLTAQGGTTDLTTIAGFSSLDPETQVFLINLRDTTAARPSNVKFREQAYALLVIRDCETEFPTANHNHDAGGSEEAKS